jgi:polysaccharide pyruvyl transferase WcaK-like protein
MTKQKPVKISFFGHYGTLNFGNEATLLAIVSRLRLRFPNCEFSCICSYPENVIATHGIHAVPHTVRSVRIWDRQIPLGKRARMAFLGLSEEVREYVRAWRVLEGADMFVIPGTGLLTDSFGLSGMGPYGLLKWSLTARLRGCRVVFVSVGAGPVHGRLARLLLKYALSIAEYRSYRDDPSREVVASLGVRTKNDRVYPDLVFGLPASLLPTTTNREGRPIVGLGLMEYFEKYSVANPMHDTYERYLDSLAVVVGWLVEHEYDVKLLLGDADYDTLVVADLRAVLRKRLAANIDEHVTDHSIGSLHELLSQLSATDLVVATRFHNVLMSLLLNKPVIAISFHHKCSSLMSDMGLSEYCQDINRMNPDALIAMFEQLAKHADELERMIALEVEEAQSALDEQYEVLFELSIDPSRPITPSRPQRDESRLPQRARSNARESISGTEQNQFGSG